MTYHITPDHGHYTVYINGKFYCTADSWNEAVSEIENYRREMRHE